MELQIIEKLCAKHKDRDGNSLKNLFYSLQARVELGSWANDSRGRETKSFSTRTRTSWVSRMRVRYDQIPKTGGGEGRVRRKELKKLSATG